MKATDHAIDSFTGYDFDISICKGNIVGGSITTAIQVMTTIDGHIVHTTEGKPWPAIWDEHITHRFNTLQPTTPVLLTFSLYRKRFTTKAWKLVGSVHFSLHEFVRLVNKGPIQQDFQVILNQKSLITFSGSITLKFQIVNKSEILKSLGDVPNDNLKISSINEVPVQGREDKYNFSVSHDLERSLKQGYLSSSTATDEQQKSAQQQDAFEEGKSKQWRRRMSAFGSSFFHSPSHPQSQSSEQVISEKQSETDDLTNENIRIVRTVSCSDSEEEGSENQDLIKATKQTTNISQQQSNTILVPLSPARIPKALATKVPLCEDSVITSTANEEEIYENPRDWSFYWFLVIFVSCIVICTILYWQLYQLNFSVNRLESILADLSIFLNNDKLHQL